MNYKDINTTDKMNKNVKEMLLLKNDNVSLYALKRTKEFLMQFMQFEKEQGYYKTTDILDSFEYRIQAYNDYWFK